MMKARNIKPIDAKKFEKLVKDINVLHLLISDREKTLGRSLLFAEKLWLLADVTGVTPDEIKGVSRKQHIIHAKRVLIGQMRTYGHGKLPSFPSIARQLNVDHSTVVYHDQMIKISADFHARQEAA